MNVSDEVHRLQHSIYLAVRGRGQSEEDPDYLHPITGNRYIHVCTHSMEYAWLGIQPGMHILWVFIDCKLRDFSIYVYLQLTNLNVCVFSTELTMAIRNLADLPKMKSLNHALKTHPTVVTQSDQFCPSVGMKVARFQALGI